MAREYTRKQLKHDEFVEGMWSLERWIEQHWGLLVKGLGALVLVGILITAGLLWMKSRGESARRLFTEGLGRYTAATADPGGAGTAAPEAALSESLALFEQAAARGGGEVARVARFYQGATLVRLGRAGEAVPLLERVSAAGDADALGTAARALLAEALIAGGDTERALQTLRQLATGGAYAEQSLYQLGVLLEAQGRPEEARQALQDLLRRFPQGAFAEEAQGRLSRLG